MADKQLTGFIKGHYNGQPGFYNEQTKEFIPKELMQKGFYNGQKAWYNPEIGYIEEPESPIAQQIPSSEEQQALTHTDTDTTIYKPMTWGQAAIKGVGNLPLSTVDMLGGVYGAVRHPIDTAKTLGSVVAGGAQKLYPGKQQQESAFDALINSYKNRYGTAEGLKEAIANDPASILLDASSLFTGGGAAAGRAGLTATGKALKTAGKITDPMNIVTKPLSAAAKAGKKVYSPIVGKITGTGKEAIEYAFKGGKEFKEALRGKTKLDDIMLDVKDGLTDIRKARNAEYQARLQNISGVNVIGNKMNILRKTEELMNNYGISLRYDAKGRTVIDMSKTKIDASARQQVKNVIKDVMDWEDLSPIGMDTLKQRVDDMYAPTKNSGAFISELRKTIKDEIVSVVPEYADMTKGYSKATESIMDIEKTLSAGKKMQKDTALRKLQTVFRDVNEYRLAKVRELDTLHGGKISQQLAGIALKDFLPRGYFASFTPFIASMSMATVLHNPAVLLFMGAASPRVMGEITFKIGQMSKALQNTYGKIPEAAKIGALQTGQVTKTTQSSPIPEGMTAEEYLEKLRVK